jgi:DnaK suppressor protein
VTAPKAAPQGAVKTHAAAKAAQKVAAKTPTAAKVAKSSAQSTPPAAAVKKSPVPKASLTQAKTPAKSSAKTPAKAPVKPATPAKSKTAAKPLVKTAGKAVSQAMVQTPSKTLSQPPMKTPVKAPAKVAVKAPIQKAVSSAKTVKLAAKTPVKAAAKPPVKPLAKAPVKTAAKTLAKAATVAIAPKIPLQKAAPAGPKASALLPSKEVLKSVKAIAKAPSATPSEKVTPPRKAVASPAAPAVAAAPEPVAAVAGDVPARATRPSARLAQITVPSMAQSVASTAAKASYLHNPPTPVMIPVFTAPAKKDAKLANNWKTKPLDQLVDAEILAMSDDDYMNVAQLAFFRRKLVLLKDDMLANAGQTTENLREDTVVVPDPADRATIEEEHALELRTRDRERKLLKKIQQSITRIDAGDYGYCDETGEPIGVGRLLARPTATLSLEAQQRRELKQKMFGD